MLKHIIEEAEQKAGSQQELSKRFKINYRRLCDYKAGRRKPDDADVVRMAQYIGLDPIKALFESKAEYDSENKEIWKWCARLESNQRPSASESVGILKIICNFMLITLNNHHHNRLSLGQAHIGS